MDELPARFWAKIDKNGPIPQDRPELGPCWLWTGALIDGYGVWWLERRNRPAHVSSFIAFTQRPIPSGLQLDHLCRVRRCCNPEHLEPVTGRENVLRGRGLAAVNAAKTACLQGHPLDETNTYIHDGKRSCKSCRIEAVRRLRARRAMRTA